MQGLCCLDAQGPHALGPMGEFIADSKEPLAVARAAQDLMRGAWDDREACDALLSRHARHWQLSRLALVDRNILRLAVFELRTDRAPFKVVVSEAIRLAREFSSAESPRFINGVLDAVARELGKKNG
jgi:N utilization substance protein B